jgi:Holliday junction resolvase RusA-like endonuclease
MEHKITLPFPPSVNNIWRGTRRKNKKMYLSKQYREWLDNKRDISNYIKAPEDYLVYQCVIEDDNCRIVESVTVNFKGVDKENPRVDITIRY